jgi:cob(I)alamin adenosyltransferase
MKIYTKTGDRGETSLVGGARVSKSDARVAAYGEVDEANAAIGVARTAAPADFADALLGAVQRDLFAIGAALATPEPKRLKERQREKSVIPAERIVALERAIDEADGELPRLQKFVLPSGTPKAAALHLARTVCRRAERAVVGLAREADVPGEVLVYLNRLSDLLFTLARLANHRAGVPDVTW